VKVHPGIPIAPGATITARADALQLASAASPAASPATITSRPGTDITADRQCNIAAEPSPRKGEHADRRRRRQRRPRRCTGLNGSGVVVLNRGIPVFRDAPNPRTHSR
jgi:hypothetical protein